MPGPRLDMAWLYLRVTVETLWECKRVRRFVWVLAFAVLIGSLISGQLSVRDFIIAIAINVVCSLRLLR